MTLRACFAVIVALATLRLSAAEPAATKNVRIDLDTPANAQPAPKPSSAARASAQSKAAPTTAGTTAKKPAKAAPPSKNTKAGGTGATAKKSEAPAKIDGLEVSRGDHGFLGIKVENNTWKISFYDHDKKPMTPDVAHIALRWPVQYQPNPERALLSPSGDGKAMTSDKTVRPPFTFTLYVTLLKDAAATDQPAETYVVAFHQ